MAEPNRKEVSICEKCKNPDECQLGCPDWVFFGEKQPYWAHYFSYIWAEGQNVVPIDKKEKKVKEERT